MPLDDKPTEMFGKIMSWPDEMIEIAFEILTDVSVKEIENIRCQLKGKMANPRDIKAKLAREITALYHGKNAAQKTEKEFNKVFKEKKNPSVMPRIHIAGKSMPILELLAKAKLTPSKSEAKRLIEQKGVKIDGRIQENWQADISTKKGIIIQVGKRKFVEIM